MSEGCSGSGILSPQILKTSTKTLNPKPQTAKVFRTTLEQGGGLLGLEMLNLVLCASPTEADLVEIGLRAEGLGQLRLHSPKDKTPPKKIWLTDCWLGLGLRI